jgi:hypothetical protein
VIDPGPPKLHGLGLVRYAFAGLVLALVVQTFGPRAPQYEQLGDTIGDAAEASVAAVDRAAHLNLAFEPGPEIECRERSGAPGYQDACDAP